MATQINVKSLPWLELQKRSKHAYVPREGPDSDVLEDSSLGGVYISTPLMLGTPYDWLWPAD